MARHIVAYRIVYEIRDKDDNLIRKNVKVLEADEEMQAVALFTAWVQQNETFEDGGEVRITQNRRVERMLK